MAAIKNVKRENQIVNKIWGETNYPKKYEMVRNYLQNIKATTQKKKQLLIECKNIQSNYELDRLVANVTLAGRGHAVVKFL